MNNKDHDMFLKALDDLPRDIIGAKYEGAPKHPAQKKVRPKASHDIVIDLHGATKNEAVFRLRITLERARGKHRRILVITGKGNNSEDGCGVLREAVARFLDAGGSAYIREYRFASPEHGGDGAYEIITK